MEKFNLKDSIKALEESKKVFVEVSDGFGEVVKAIDTIIDNLKHRQKAVDSFNRLMEQLEKGGFFGSGDGIK